MFDMGPVGCGQFWGRGARNKTRSPFIYIICNSCKKHGICGMRWKCINCPNYDLCTSCYMSDKHDLTHIFARFETSSSVG